MEILLCRTGIKGHPLITNPGLASHNDRDPKTRQLDPCLGAVNDDTIALKHGCIRADMTFGRDDKNIGRERGKGLVDLIDNFLARGNGPSNLGGMHPDEQLQIRAMSKIVDSLQHPGQHIRERVGGIMQLRVPHDVGQHANGGPGKIDPQLLTDFLQVFLGTFVEPYPILGAIPSTLKIIHDLGLHLRGPNHVLPGRNRLVHQSVVIGIAMTEDKSLFPIGWIPVHNAKPSLSCHFADDTLRDINAVMETGDIEIFLIQQALGRIGCEQSSLKIASQHRLCIRFLFQSASGKIAQRASQSMFSHCQAVQLERRHGLARK